MKFCALTVVGTWTNWSTFEPDPDYSLDAGTGLLSPISYALQRGILILLRRENPTYRYWAPVAAARRGFKMVLFTASRGNTFVRGTYALLSALLVDNNFGKCGPIFKILLPKMIRKKILYVHTTKISTLPAIICYTTLWKSKIQKNTKYSLERTKTIQR